MRYTLIISGDIEQAVIAFNERITEEVTIESAHYDAHDHKSALKVAVDILSASHSHPDDIDERFREQLEQWRAERGTTGMLTFYSPYWGKGEGSPFT